MTMEVQKFRSSERDCTESTELVNGLLNIPAKLDKKTCEDKNFASADEQGIYAVGCKIASAVCARYYKGLAAHGDNLVIVRIE